MNFKILIVGDCGVGKSCTMLRFTTNGFIDSHISTIGVDFRSKMVKQDDKEIKLQIWDTAGQERFHTITKSYYRGADGVVLMYDITNKESFDHITDWFRDVERYGNPDAIKFIVGNKSDSGTSRRVPAPIAAKLAQSLGVRFFEISAKNDESVDEMFSSLARRIVQLRTRYIEPSVVDISEHTTKSRCCI